MDTLGTERHVHCWTAFPHGDMVYCLRAPLEPDSQIEVGGVIYRPLLVWRNNCLVMRQDQVRAYVVVPGENHPVDVVDRTKELISTGAGELS